MGASARALLPLPRPLTRRPQLLSLLLLTLLHLVLLGLLLERGLHLPLLAPRGGLTSRHPSPRAALLRLLRQREPTPTLMLMPTPTLMLMLMPMPTPITRRQSSSWCAAQRAWRPAPPPLAPLLRLGLLRLGLLRWGLLQVLLRLLLRLLMGRPCAAAGVCRLHSPSPTHPLLLPLLLLCRSHQPALLLPLPLPLRPRPRRLLSLPPQPLPLLPPPLPAPRAAWWPW